VIRLVIFQTVLKLVQLAILVFGCKPKEQCILNVPNQKQTNDQNDLSKIKICQTARRSTAASTAGRWPSLSTCCCCCCSSCKGCENTTIAGKISSDGWQLKACDLISCSQSVKLGVYLLLGILRKFYQLDAPRFLMKNKHEVKF